MKKFLSRLVPERFQVVRALPNEKRLELFSTVGDHDPCLVAVTDGLMESLEIEFITAISDCPDAEKLRAVERMRAAYHALRNIEREREEAKTMRREREQQVAAPRQ